VLAEVTVFGAPPVASPRLVGYPHCDTAVQQWAAKLWGRFITAREAPGEGPRYSGSMGSVGAKPRGPGPTAQGLYPDYAATAAVIAEMGIPKDFRTDEPVRFTHRESLIFDEDIDREKTDFFIHPAHVRFTAARI